MTTLADYMSFQFFLSFRWGWNWVYDGGNMTFNSFWVLGNRITWRTLLCRRCKESFNSFWVLEETWIQQHTWTIWEAFNSFWVLDAQNWGDLSPYKITIFQFFLSFRQDNQCVHFSRLCKLSAFQFFLSFRRPEKQVLCLPLQIHFQFFLSFREKEN